MPSLFAWLDTDDDQRRRMLALVELFKDEGTVDELGIGAIRDTIADVLFPGTSVLHTRARYLLFVPWLLLKARRSATPASAAVEEFRRLEVRLIYSLLAGGETEGVIGRQAKDGLKRMPSAAYWAATYRYRIRVWDTSVDGYFRKALAADARRGAEAEAGELGVSSDDRGTGLDPYLPPAPGDLLAATTFELSKGEAGFLRDHVLATTRGSLFAWLLTHARPAAVAQAWLHPAAADYPAVLRRVVDHGRRFHTVIHGAALLYNLMLAEQRQSDELIDEYRDGLGAWERELTESRALDAWDQADFWAMLGERNPRIGQRTRSFVTRWVSGAAQGARVAEDQVLRDLVKQREVLLKGGRARLVNPSALDVWRGKSGLVRLDYRWSVARLLIDDIYRAEQSIAG